ncbi:MAG: hypothetical protein U1E28_22395 [Beijerinckiaceae bacterium]
MPLGHCGWGSPGEVSGIAAAPAPRPTRLAALDTLPASGEGSRCTFAATNFACQCDVEQLGASSGKARPAINAAMRERRFENRAR